MSAWKMGQRWKDGTGWEKKEKDWNLPGGPVIVNLPSNAGDVRSIPGQGLNLLWRCML